MDQLPAFKSKVPKIEGREQLTIESADKTIKSEKEKHPVNQDTILVDAKHRAFGVFDGMGGHKAGETASQMACDYVLAYLPKILNGTNVEQAKAALLEIFIGADKAIYGASMFGTDYQGMGTTSALLKFHIDAEEKEWKIIVGIGDSRIYEINENGTLKQLTVDDDFLNQLNLSSTDKERIAKQIEDARSLQDLADDLTKTCFKRRNLIGKCLGLGNVIPSISASPVEKGDRFLIISDGVHKSFSNQEFQNIFKEVLGQSATPDNVVKNLIQRSLEKSREPEEKNFRAGPDDMSAVFIEVS